MAPDGIALNSPLSNHAESVFADLHTRLRGRLRLGPFSRTTRIGLRRDLAVPFEAPTSKIPITVRVADSQDFGVLLPASTRGLSHDDRLEIAWRRAFLVKGAPRHRCFVAIDGRDGQPCYMQWLLHPEHNLFIGRLGGFPALRGGETLLENAYTPAGYRGLGIMPAAMARIADIGASEGAHFALTFVDQHNAASLKGCSRAGFAPYLEHHRTQLGFGILKWDTFQ